MSDYLIRARLRRSPEISALGRVLLPEADDERIAAEHHLVWSLFARDADRKRDFLWRAEAPGHYLILASEPPARSTLFDIEAKSFAPELEAGDQLAFMLRANATQSYRSQAGQRGQRADVVMHALYQVDRGTARAQARPGAILTSGSEWLARQGARAGFSLPMPPAVDGYDTRRLQRYARAGGGKLHPTEFGVLDISGILRIEDPALFLKSLRQGFGRAKAFGCGLMLIRRVG